MKGESRRKTALTSVTMSPRRLMSILSAFPSLHSVRWFPEESEAPLPWGLFPWWWWGLVGKGEGTTE